VRGITARLYELRTEERQRLVEFLAYLGELERRRLHLDLGFGSTFAFCTEHLGLTKASAYRRTTAARLLSRFPVIAAYLADGRLNLTTLVELRDVLCDDRLAEILDRAAGRSEEEVKMLVAALQPRPDPPDLLRRLPSATPTTSDTAEPSQVGSGPVLTAPAASQPTFSPRSVACPAAVAPIAEERFVLRAAVSRAFVDDLKTVRALLSHRIPDGDLEAVLHEALRLAAGVLTKRRRGAGKAATGEEPGSSARRTRHIAAAIRDEVWRRDDARCAFLSADGRRCNSRHQLEVHHRVPFGKGGASTVSNLELRCRAHNLRAAELDYGEAASRRRRKQRASTSALLGAASGPERT
jgi:hypothetical protein